MAHVVIADGDYGVLYLLQHLLRTLGWTYVSALDGIEAWNLVQQVIPDLVIADANLAGINGLELTQMIKRQPRLTNIPVVLLGPSQQEGLAVSVGAEAFISKPFGGQAILSLLPRLVTED